MKKADLMKKKQSNKVSQKTSNTHVVIEKITDLLKIPLHQLSTVQISHFSGDYFSKLYEEAVAIESNQKLKTPFHENDIQLSEKNTPNNETKKNEIKEKTPETKKKREPRKSKDLDESVKTTKTRNKTSDKKKVTPSRKLKAKKKIIDEEEKKLEADSLQTNYKVVNNPKTPDMPLKLKKGKIQKLDLSRSKDNILKRKTVKHMHKPSLNEELLKTENSFDINNNIFENGKKKITRTKSNLNNKSNTKNNLEKNKPKIEIKDIDNKNNNQNYNNKNNTQTNPNMYNNIMSGFSSYSNYNNNYTNYYNTSPPITNLSIINNNNSPEFSITKIVFIINYKTVFGEEVGVIGSIPQLGSWKEENLMYLNWNEGNDWIGILNINQNSLQDFEFKFVVTKNKKVVCWESGNNNKFILNGILNEIKNNKTGPYNKYSYEYNKDNGELKLKCVWGN